MGKYFATIAGQSDWSRHCFWLSCLTYGQSRRHRGVGWANLPQTVHQAPQTKIWKLNEWNFVNVYNVKASTGKQKTHSNHDVVWFSPRTHTNHNVWWFSLRDCVATTPAWVESPRVSISGVWVIVAQNLKAINADKCSPSLPLGTWTSFRSGLMVDRFHSVVWSQSSCPQ